MNITANAIKIAIAPTYTRICTMPMNSAFSVKKIPATDTNETVNATTERTRSLSVTTNIADAIAIADATKKASVGRSPGEVSTLIAPRPTAASGHRLSGAHDGLLDSDRQPVRHRMGCSRVLRTGAGTTNLDVF